MVLGVNVLNSLSLIVVLRPVIRGVTQSDLRIVTGFGPFNLPTCDQLQRGRDHSHCRSPAFVMFVGVGRCSVGVLFLCLNVRGNIGIFGV